MFSKISNFISSITNPVENKIPTEKPIEATEDKKTRPEKPSLKERMITAIDKRTAPLKELNTAMIQSDRKKLLKAQGPMLAKVSYYQTGILIDRVLMRMPHKIVSEKKHQKLEKHVAKMQFYRQHALKDVDVILNQGRFGENLLVPSRNFVKKSEAKRGGDVRELQSVVDQIDAEKMGISEEAKQIFMGFASVSHGLSLKGNCSAQSSAFIAEYLSKKRTSAKGTGDLLLESAEQYRTGQPAKTYATHSIETIARFIDRFGEAKINRIANRYPPETAEAIFHEFGQLLYFASREKNLSPEQQKILMQETLERKDLDPTIKEGLKELLGENRSPFNFQVVGEISNPSSYFQGTKGKVLQEQFHLTVQETSMQPENSTTKAFVQDQLKNMDDGAYYVGFAAAENAGHAIACIKEADSIYILDPNIGLIKCDPEDPDKTFMQVLHRYKGIYREPNSEPSYDVNFEKMEEAAPPDTNRA